MVGSIDADERGLPGCAGPETDPPALEDGHRDLVLEAPAGQPGMAERPWLAGRPRGSPVQLEPVGEVARRPSCARVGDPWVGAGLREVLPRAHDVPQRRIPEDGVVDVLARVQLVRPDVRLVADADVLGEHQVEAPWPRGAVGQPAAPPPGTVLWIQ